MTGLFDSAIIEAAFHIVLGFGVGALLGLAHFASLRWNAELYLDRGVALGLGLQLLRLAVLGAVLFALVQIGAGALLSGTLGLLAVRRFLVRSAGGLP